MASHGNSNSRAAGQRSGAGSGGSGGSDEQGYDVEMASGQPMDDKYLCPVCLSVMRDAMQTVCGHRFCKICITRVAGDRPWGRCPVDKTALRRSEQLFNDVAMRREILSLTIKCKNSAEQCTWTGELRDAEKHLKECSMETVPCPLSCQKWLRRGEVSRHTALCPKRSITCSHCNENIVFNKIHKHEVVDCSQFPVPCTLCGQTGIPRGDIARHMDSTTGSCPQANVVCKFRAVGCHFQDKRKDMQQHYDAHMQSHLSLLMGRVGDQSVTIDLLRDENCANKGKLAETSAQLAEQALTLALLKDRTVSGGLLWKLDLSSMQPLPNMVFSPPFFTSCPGYQMRVRLDFRGVSDGDQTFYSSVFVIVQKGEFDQDLMFPFNGQVKVKLLPQVSGRAAPPPEVSTMIHCKDVPRNSSGNVNARVNSRGCTRFLKHRDLVSNLYAKNNVIYMEVSVLSPGETTANTTTTTTTASTNGVSESSIIVSPV